MAREDEAKFYYRQMKEAELKLAEVQEQEQHEEFKATVMAYLALIDRGELPSYDSWSTVGRQHEKLLTRRKKIRNLQAEVRA